MAKKSAKKVARKGVRKTAPKGLQTIVVGKKKRNDVEVQIRIPTDLAETLKCMQNRSGEVRISEDRFHEAVHGYVASQGPNRVSNYTVKIDNDGFVHGVDIGQMPMVEMNTPQEEAKSNSILLEAQDIIFGDREQTYGSPDLNLVSIGDFWTAYLRRKRCVQNGSVTITAEDVCQMMILLKTARLLNQPEHRDSLTDQAGYAALQQRIHDERPF